MRSVHVGLAWLVIAWHIATGVWATAAQWVPSVRTTALMPLTYAGWALVVAQVTVGVVLLQVEGLEAGGLHYVYGFLAMASIAIIYSYRQQVEQWQYALFGVGNLFIMGLAVRAVFLDPAVG